MDWAVFDKNTKRLEGPYDDAADGEIIAEMAAHRYSPETGAWAGPVCDWHPDVPRESCPGFPHE
ncbi:hypothetical protein [Streptomyces sp. 6N106]|uniref:hypothetical protein n=1 Tax=Streptomyces sp. 6N106 TaxID=3457418 RepID=UPI003FD3966E